MHDKRTYRDILIRGDQTFACFHDAIYHAFDREEEHLYRFIVTRSIPGMNELQKKFRKQEIPGNRRRIEYIEALEIACPECCEHNDSWADEQFNAEDTPICKFDFAIKQKFEYMFDFGDEWNHEIEVREITPVVPQQNYPFVVKVNGESPSQYDWADDDCNDEDEPQEVVFHEKLLDEIKKRLPDWDGEIALISIDDDFSADTVIGNRAKFSIDVGARTLDNISFSSIRDLFRESECPPADSESPLYSAFEYGVDVAIAAMVESGQVSSPSDNELVEIFSAMRRRPDGRSISLMHDVIWRAAVMFLLEYECSQSAYEAFFLALEHQAKSFRQGFQSYEYLNFCRDNFDDESGIGGFNDDIDTEIDEEECLCPQCRAKLIRLKKSTGTVSTDEKRKR